MDTIVKMLPLLLFWMAAVSVLFRYFEQKKRVALFGGGFGFLAGAFLPLLLAAVVKGDIPFQVARSVSAAAFAVLFAVSAAAFYRSAGVIPGASPMRHLAGTAFPALCVSFSTALSCAALIVFMFPQQEAAVPLAAAILGLLFLALAYLLEKLLHALFAVTTDSLALFTVATILLISSFSGRLDLFAPLSMKVMKFTHDFVHQFLETMLFPDHQFIKNSVWDYIGLLFSNEVGFWVGLLIWFAPPFLVILAIGRSRLPQLSHVRQGAERRRLLAGYLLERRRRLAVPLFSAILLALAVYKSSFPEVEYWDPRPIPLIAAAGELFVPLYSGEYDLRDGKLHKFIFREAGKSFRFFVLQKGDGRMTAALDACSICQPEGYGQTEGSVVCFYCKTLIPLETVGSPGGCNPVPLKFVAGKDGVRIASRDLVTTWEQTVQQTKKVPGEGR